MIYMMYHWYFTRGYDFNVALKTKSRKLHTKTIKPKKYRVQVYAIVRLVLTYPVPKQEKISCDDDGSPSSADTILNEVPKNSRTSRKNWMLYRKFFQFCKTADRHIKRLTFALLVRSSDTALCLRFQVPCTRARKSDVAYQRSLPFLFQITMPETQEGPYLRDCPPVLRQLRSSVWHQSSIQLAATKRNPAIYVSRRCHERRILHW